MLNNDLYRFYSSKKILILMIKDYFLSYDHPYHLSFGGASADSLIGGTQIKKSNKFFHYSSLN